MKSLSSPGGEEWIDVEMLSRKNKRSSLRRTSGSLGGWELFSPKTLELWQLAFEFAVTNNVLHSYGDGTGAMWDLLNTIYSLTSRFVSNCLQSEQEHSTDKPSQIVHLCLENYN
jgi:hypothetical protein